MADDRSDESEVHWEALERALNETEVLSVIYGTGEDNDVGDSTGTNLSSHFAVVSPDQSKVDLLKKKFGLLSEEEDDDDDDDDQRNEPRVDSLLVVPDLKIEIRIQSEGKSFGSESTTTSSTTTTILIRCLLSRGYPETSPAVVTFLQTSPQPLGRKKMDEITLSLNEKAKDLLGTEAVMDLIEETKALILQQQEDQHRKSQQQQQQQQPPAAPIQDAKIGRRWIWVHHITKTDRIASIRKEAREHNLSGILKHGYPGVVLVEGLVTDCDSFVKWIKADKSSPHGGFGRNWGHHVRGEINEETTTTTTTDAATAAAACVGRYCCGTLEATDDLSVMADYCRKAGLEDEFREYVLQHK